jgi:hypothetical protein
MKPAASEIEAAIRDGDLAHAEPTGEQIRAPANVPFHHDYRIVAVACEDLLDHVGEGSYTEPQGALLKVVEQLSEDQVGEFNMLASWLVMVFGSLNPA